MSTIPPISSSSSSFESSEPQYNTLNSTQISLLIKDMDTLHNMIQQGEINQSQLNSIKNHIHSLLSQQPPLSPQQQKYLAQAASLITQVQNGTLTLGRLYEVASDIYIAIQTGGQRLS